MVATMKNESGINLRKVSQNVNRILIELGWKPKSIFNILANLMDVEAGIICIEKGQKCGGVVYYGNPTYVSESIVYYQNSVTDSRSRHTKQLIVTLDDIPAKVDCLAITLNIHSAFEKYQHFGEVKDCYIRVSDYEARKELIRYNIVGNFNDKTAIFVADLHRSNEDWKMSLVGHGVEVENIKEMIKMRCK